MHSENFFPSKKLISMRMKLSIKNILLLKILICFLSQILCGIEENTHEKNLIRLLTENEMIYFHESKALKELFFSENFNKETLEHKYLSLENLKKEIKKKICHKQYLDKAFDVFLSLLKKFLMLYRFVVENNDSDEELIEKIKKKKTSSELLLLECNTFKMFDSMIESLTRKNEANKDILTYITDNLNVLKKSKLVGEIITIALELLKEVHKEAKSKYQKHFEVQAAPVVDALKKIKAALKTIPPFTDESEKYVKGLFENMLYFYELSKHDETSNDASKIEKKEKAINNMIDGMFEDSLNEKSKSQEFKTSDLYEKSINLMNALETFLKIIWSPLNYDCLIKKYKIETETAESKQFTEEFDLYSIIEFIQELDAKIESKKYFEFSRINFYLKKEKIDEIVDEMKAEIHDKTKLAILNHSAMVKIIIQIQVDGLPVIQVGQISGFFMSSAYKEIRILAEILKESLISSESKLIIDSLIDEIMKRIVIAVSTDKLFKNDISEVIRRIDLNYRKISYRREELCLLRSNFKSFIGKTRNDSWPRRLKWFKKSIYDFFL